MKFDQIRLGAVSLFPLGLAAKHGSQEEVKIQTNH